MVTDCQNCPLRSRPIFVSMTDDEVAFMRHFKTGELVVEAGSTLMMEASNSPQLFTALEGMGLRYKTLESGERQVINFVMPGDFIGLQAGVMQEMYHSVEATTRMKLCVFDRARLWELFRGHPDRAFDLTWIAAVEEHLLGESLAILGHMNGLERIARALARLYDRAKAIGLAEGLEMPLPYKQQDLADALGLSLVHANKMIKRLRLSGAATWRNGRLTIHDFEQLCRIGKFDEGSHSVQRPLI